MARLTAAARNAIAPKNFALPGRRYPIEDASHARNALARVSQHGSAQEQATVRAKVKAAFPGIGGDHVAQARAHVAAAGRKHSMDAARAHLDAAKTHLAAAMGSGAATPARYTGEAHAYDFRKQ